MRRAAISHPNGGCRCTIEHCDDTMLLILQGELCAAVTPWATAEALRAVDRAVADGIGAVRLDLSGVTLLSAAGITMLLAVRAAAIDRGMEARVDRLSPAARRILELCVVHRLVPAELLW